MRRLNILMIGSANSFTNRLIRQFNKEGHRVSLLTGSSLTSQKYPRVFERYDFSYTSGVLPEVFCSVSPDVTVFAGAYDGTFAWEDERNDAVSYVTAVMNILSAYSETGKGRLLYISSDAVFHEDDERLYSEEDEMSAGNPHSTALVQAEDICRQYMADPGTDIVIVRLSGYYHLTKEPENVDDFVSEFCIDYLKNGKVSVPDSRLIMPMAGSDAVFFISKLALAPTHRFSVYHLASGERLTAAELKSMIAEAAKQCGYTIPTGGRASAGAEEGKGLSAWIRRFLERRADRGRDNEPNLKSKNAFVHLRYPQAMLNAELAMVDQLKRETEQETEKITATIAAEMRKDVASIAADAQLKVAEINLNAAKIQAEITRTRGEAEARAKFLVENEKALGAKRRADVFKDAGTLADLQFVDSLSPNLSIRVLHSGEGTLWTDLKGSSLALPSASGKK